MGVRTTQRKLKGTEKAAIILLSLPEELVTNIMSHLEPDEIRELSQAMMGLGTVKPKVIEATFVEFTNELSSTGSLVGTIEKTERLLEKVLPADQVARILEEISGPAGKTLWDKLSNVNEDLLANFLKNEYPQTVALVLSRIPPENASRVLSLFPQSFCIDAIERILKLEPVRKEILEEIEETLRNEFMSSFSRGARQDNHELVAEMFNHLDRSTEARLIKGLQIENPQSAELIKSLMFTFEDLGEFDDTTIQTIIRSVDKGKLSIALKGASDTLRILFFKSMSERAGRLLAEDMQALGMVRLRDVEDAQSSIVAITKDLAASGAIFISSKADPREQLIG